MVKTFDITELNAQKRPFLLEQVEINRKYNFASFEVRSAEDNERFAYCGEQMDLLVQAFDDEHPLEPCPKCGYKRYASHGSDRCFNIGRCTEAPSAMGG